MNTPTTINGARLRTLADIPAAALHPTHATATHQDEHQTPAPAMRRGDVAVPRKPHSTRRARDAQGRITVRFDDAEFDAIEQAARAHKVSGAELLRQAWRERQRIHLLQMQLRELEHRLTRRTFEMLCTLGGVDIAQRRALTDAINSEFGEVVL